MEEMEPSITFTTTTNLTPDKKWNLLFDNEAAKNYPPPTITSAVKKYATTLGLRASTSELKRQEVTNIKYKICGPLKAHLVCNFDLKSDITKSVAFLIEKGYCVKCYYASHQSNEGVVFAYPKQLEKLEKHGWLTLIDSTHKTNKYDWRLFTLYIRDIYRCWDISAYFFVSSENCDTVAEALKIIHQSGIEAKGVKKAFSDINAGEQECENKDWFNGHFGHVNIIRVAKSQIIWDLGCQNAQITSIWDLGFGISAKDTNYNLEFGIWDFGIWDFGIWILNLGGRYSQHSPLLLQVTTTNPLESYYSELKRLTSSLHGLIGTVHNIVDIDYKKRSDSERVAFDFRTKKVSAYRIDDNIIEEIHKFPFSLQNLLVKEACAVMDRIEKDKGPPDLTSHNCYCLMFEESGYEIYEGCESIIEFVEIEKQKETENRRLTVVELTERIRDRY
ncbi:hypothetical protein Glove_186g2 [Diversispora epigaea]|uniref:ZSWIM1/3 RNaseH-like domain-containing protein n=1 Tax=Diversispora epigaea TaxID=1348612 RepID=A0A397IVE0_9GLOM|nr:hypothetical protein Glove_186g2 [Diversispora epigaea]